MKIEYYKIGEFKKYNTSLVKTLQFFPEFSENFGISKNNRQRISFY